MVGMVEGAIDVAAVRAAVTDPAFGAILVFEGVGRDNVEGKQVVHLAYQAYGPMAQQALQAICAEAVAKWPGVRVAMVHRTGQVAIGEPSVVIAVGSPHRDEGYQASRYCLEQLKHRVPIWKKEQYADGSEWKANTPGCC